MKKYAIGLDYGTLSVRALLVDISDGTAVAQSVYEYPHACMETHIPTGEPLPSSVSSSLAQLFPCQIPPLPATWIQRLLTRPTFDCISAWQEGLTQQDFCSWWGNTC